MTTLNKGTKVLMKRIYRILIFLSVILTFESCDYFTKIFCGELEGEYKQMVADINNRYKYQLVIEPIPCDPIYINVLLKTANVDTSIIRSIHKKLYKEDSIPTVGWQTLVIYDNKRNYLFSHSYNGYIYKQTGD